MSESKGMSTQAPLTADFLWIVHRAALGGKSSVTGAELPASLDGCPPGARAAHYAMALAAAWHVDPTAKIPVPEGVSPDDATLAEMVVAEILGNAPAEPASHPLAPQEVFLDGLLRPWGRTPLPMVEDPWNWIPEFKLSGELAGHIRVRRGPKPSPDTWPTAPPAYEVAARAKFVLVP